VKFILLLSLPLYVLDQCTKRLALRFINPFDAHNVIPDFFTLVNVTNNGAAFGTFKGNNTFFAGISIVALVVVTVLLVRPHRADPWRDLSLALLLAGILGNLTDRPRLMWLIPASQLRWCCLSFTRFGSTRALDSTRAV